MKFEKHLFISYAHLDNRPVSEKTKGWVSRLHESLDAWLTMRLGQDAVIWRDPKLSGTDVFADEIVDQFPKVAFLLCILSPRYVDSDSCKSEISKFCEIAERTIGLMVANKCRIVKLIKAPFEKDPPFPEIMSAVLGYQFYELDEDGTPLELDPDLFDEARAQKFNMKVAKLATELTAALKKIEGASGPEPAKEKSAVYLAESSYDQRNSRDALETELKCHGYRVLPEHELSRDEDKYIAEVAQLLERCQLSIHLIGNQYGPVPDGPTDKSIVVLQNEVAARCSREQRLRRIIWLPEGTDPKGDHQRDFIHQLHTDAEAQFGADLITAREMETVKTAIHSALAQARPASEPPEEANRLIYLICDQRDRQQTIQLRMWLRKRGFEVRLPVFEGVAATVRQENERLLRECKAVMVFYGQGTEAWKRSVEGEIKKLRIGSTTNLPMWTYLAGPDTDDKRDLIEMQEARHIDGRVAFAEDAALPFLQELERLRS